MRHSRIVVLVLVLTGVVCCHSSAQSDFWQFTLRHSSEISCIAVGTNGQVYVGVRDSAYYRSTDNGASWSARKYSSQPGSQGTSALFVTPSGIVLASALSTVFRSTDEGQSWDSTGAFTATCFVMDTSGEILAGSSGRMQKSTDTGLTWHDAGLSTITSYSLACSNRNYLFAGTINGGVYRSTNSGFTWASTGIDGIGVYGVATFGDNVVYCATSGFGILKSTDNASTWDSSGTGMTGTYWGVVVSSNGDVFAVQRTTGAHGTAYGVVKSVDSGKTWTKINMGLLDTAVTCITYGANGFLWIGTSTGFVYRSSEQITAVESYVQPPRTYFLFQNYPNPFNPSTRISYTVAHESFVTLRIYDILGRKVATLVNERKQFGDNSVQWNAEGMPTGVYLYRLQAGSAGGGFVETKKMLLIR